jgi:hypothetical protein
VSTANSAVLNYRGTLALQLGRFPPLLATGVGSGPGAAIVNGSVGGLGHLTTLQLQTYIGGSGNPRGAITGTGIVFVTDPNAAPLIEMRGAVNLGPGTLAPISGAGTSAGPLTANTLPVQGLFKLCITFGNCNIIYLPLPLTLGGTAGVGIGGLFTVNGYGPGINLSVFGAPWTVKTAVVTGIPTENGGFSSISAFGFAHGPASITSSTANVGGVVQLVTPAKVVTTLGTGTIWPMFGVLTLHFVPEPGPLLLFGAGLTALGIARRRRTKK